MRDTIVAFGEMLMRLSPPGYQRLIQATGFDAVYAGSEANVLISLAQMGCQTKYITRLPENPLGGAARNALRHWGVDTCDVVWGGKRLGLYYLEQGAALRGVQMRILRRNGLDPEAVLVKMERFVSCQFQ